jgi:hypothetical protein
MRFRYSIYMLTTLITALGFNERDRSIYSSGIEKDVIV